MLYKNTVTLISNTGLDSLRSSSTNIVLLDTRTKKEYEVSHIDGSEFYDYSSFETSDLKGIDETDTIVVYCSIGYRSERIGEKLQKAGYKNVYNLYGGIFHWKNEGGVVVNDQNDTTEKVHAYNYVWGKFLKKGEKVYLNLFPRDHSTQCHRGQLWPKVSVIKRYTEPIVHGWFVLER